MPGTQVTFTGSGFGASQGNGVVWLGSTAGQVVSWSDTQVVATVAAGSLTGIARIEQNDVWSNAFGFWVLPPGSNAVAQITSRRNPVPARYAATLMQRRRSLLDGGNAPGSHAVPRFTLRPDQVPGGNTMTLEPSLLNMSVGGTATIQALGANGLPVTGLPWTSSNPDVVSLSTGDPPILTALAAGHVTIVAGTAPNAASADVTVFTGPLPIGTVIWSNPGDGSGVNYIVPAVPSTSGVADVFAFQADGTVQAITSDGTVAWTADLSQARYALPDFQGGLAVVGQLLAGQSSIYKLDGTTGQPYPAYTASGTASLGAYGGSLVAVHPDGTIFAVQQNSDPATYSEWDSVIGIDPTTGAQKFSVDLHSWPGFVWDIMIAGDGYAYVVSSSRDFSANTSQLYLLRVNSSGAYDDFGQIAEWPGAGGDILDPNVGMITNADQGILLTWSAGGGGMALTAGTGVSLVNQPAGPGGGVVPILQAQDGSFVGSYYNDMIAFDASGTARWIVPNETPQIATADGGVIGQSGITYDQNGNATGMIASLPTYSWLGYAYQDGPTTQVQARSLYAALGFWSFLGGYNGGNGTAVNQQWFPELKSCTDPGGSCTAKLAARDLLWNAKNDLVGQLNNNSSCSAAAKKYVYDVLKVGGILGFFRHSIVNLNFTEYLHDTWHFYDGTTSTVDSRYVDGVGKNPAQTVSQLWFYPGSTNTAITVTPSYPLQTFWQPADARSSPQQIGIDSTKAGMNLLNESNLFHEALHGYTGYTDSDIQGYFHAVDPSVVVQDDTSNISAYIQKWVLSACPMSTR